MIFASFCKESEFHRLSNLKSDGYSGEHKSSRFRVDSIGGHGSRLIVKDYRATVDNGVYRCFAERYDDDREERDSALKKTIQLRIL